MPLQSRHWCFTINNWTAEEDSHLRNLTDSVDYLVLGYELSGAGTPHIQGYVFTKRKKRLSEIRNLMCPRGHFEVKRGSAKEAADYCKKDGLFFEFGVVPSGCASGGILMEFKNWALSFASTNGRAPSDQEIALSDFGHLFLQYGGRMSNYCRLIAPPTRLIHGVQTLRPWQAALHAALIDSPPGS